MRKGHSVSVLLMAVFWVIFVPSIEAGPWGPLASTGEDLHGSAQVASRNEIIPLSSSWTGTDMLQFKAGGHLLGFQPRKVYIASLDHALSVEFLGTPGVMPRTAAGGRQTDKESKVRSLGRVVYEELWEGISLTYEAREGGITESTYHIGPWADLSKIRLGYNVPVEVQRDGSLRFKFELGYLTESAPVAWQEIGGERVPVAVAFRVKGGEVGFRVGKYDPNYPLTIDPTYAWHTFYGSSNIDQAFGIATDGSGNIYITGASESTWNGPAGQPALHAHSNGLGDIFVLKLDSSGAYQWHTFYGSSLFGSGRSIATDGSGDVYITGTSNATWNGPAGQPPLHAHSGASHDIFVLKLDSSGTYQWHTFYESTSTPYGNAIAINGNGNVYITGTSSATWNGPAGQSPLHAHSGFFDIVVLKLDSSGSYQWHTFYGSTPTFDYGYRIATDGSGYVYATGRSDAAWNGPAGQSPLHAHSGASIDIFVLKLDSSGSYQWHTFYGSSSWDDGDAIATDGSGNVYVAGLSEAAWNGPAGQSPLHAYSGIYDIFVLKLDSSGAYQWHTFYGSSNIDQAFGIATDASGSIYVAGYSDALWNGPAGQSPLHAHSGAIDILVLKLNSSGSYLWHAFYGSSSGDLGNAIATDGIGNVYVTGESWATWNGPAGQSPLHAYSGENDIFVLKLSDAPSSCDFDGDGKTDIAVYRASTGAWYVYPSSGAAPYGLGWGGNATDKPVPGDYDGDGKTDVAVYRTSAGAWYVYPSSGVAPYGLGWGGDATDKPVPGDYDGDGKTDIAVYRASTGAWYVLPSSGATPYGLGWGGDTSDKPAPGDYDGDGKADIAVYRTTTGAWYVNPSSGVAPYGLGWGGDATDKPAPGDYDRDGKTDIAVYRTSTGAWYIYPSGGGSPYGLGWGGNPTDIPVPGDYDGDGKTDVAVYRAGTGAWYVLPSGGGSPYGVGWGGDISDVPVTTNPD